MEGLELSNVLMDVIMNIVNILILFVIVRALAYKPVKKFIEDRRQRSEAEKAEIAAAASSAEAMRAEYEEKLGEIEAKRREAVREGEREGQVRADELIAGARRDAERIIGDARQAILIKEAETVEGIRNSVVDLSLSIASKIIEKNMTDEDNRRLAEKFFEEEAKNTGGQRDQ